MSEYKHRMTLVVPEQLMPQANQLALIAGESTNDDQTFTNANWQDASGNLYAVCSTVIKPIVLAMFGTPVADTGLTADGADFTQAQQAMDAAIMYSGTEQASADKILIAIDYEPLAFFANCGLTIVESDINSIHQ